MGSKFQFFFFSFLSLRSGLLHIPALSLRNEAQFAVSQLNQLIVGEFINKHFSCASVRAQSRASTGTRAAIQLMMMITTKVESSFQIQL